MKSTNAELLRPVSCSWKYLLLSLPLLFRMSYECQMKVCFWYFTKFSSLRWKWAVYTSLACTIYLMLQQRPSQNRAYITLGQEKNCGLFLLSCNIQKLCKMTENFSSVSSMLTQQCLLILLNFGGRTLWLKGSQKIHSSCNCRKVSITLKLRENFFFLSGFLFLKGKQTNENIILKYTAVCMQVPFTNVVFISDLNICLTEVREKDS